LLKEKKTVKRRRKRTRAAGCIPSGSVCQKKKKLKHKSREKLKEKKGKIKEERREKLE
jgi:hypothetical protein